MGGHSLPRIEIEGHAATVRSLWSTEERGYGHFTAMQVRDRKVRGRDLHLTRLEEGSQALFGTGLDGEHVRELIHHALGDDMLDASVRVYVFGSDSGAAPAVMVTVREPASIPSTPQSLQSVPYQRSLAHIKHIGDFGQAYFGRLATKNGFDGALLVGPDGVVAEGSITNIGFAEADTIVWPDAPALHGISMQVLQRELSQASIPWGHRSVNVADIGSFDGAFITNSRGIAPVGRIDETILPTDAELVSTVMRMFAAAPWDPI
jgi:branched-subunit amino acid aminotransferase/4-amino-4-deoxychorismate lyase